MQKPRRVSIALSAQTEPSVAVGVYDALWAAGVLWNRVMGEAEVPCFQPQFVAATLDPVVTVTGVSIIPNCTFRELPVADVHVTGRTDLKGMDMILARAEVDFRSPLVAPESVEVGVRCASIGRTSFVLEQDMHERKTGRLVAEARKVLVHYDYAILRPVPIGEDLRRMILAQDPEAKQG